jgi:phosphatidylglycerophosphatase A
MNPKIPAKKTATTMSNSASTVTAASPSRRKPRISLAIATALGLGYIPKAPGTFGSLAGVALAFASPSLFDLAIGPAIDTHASLVRFFLVPAGDDWAAVFPTLYFEIALLLLVAFVGVWTASRTAVYLGTEDPQIVVIDEVSGQYLTLVIGALWPGRFEAIFHSGFGSPQQTFRWFPLNWKCVLAGFILFRVFDIWKPFPARQAESLPRGWGIMADDWIAGIYAGLGVLLLRAVGL